MLRCLSRRLADPAFTVFGMALQARHAVGAQRCRDMTVIHERITCWVIDTRLSHASTPSCAFVTRSGIYRDSKELFGKEVSACPRPTRRLPSLGPVPCAPGHLPSHSRLGGRLQQVTGSPCGTSAVMNHPSVHQESWTSTTCCAWIRVDGRIPSGLCMPSLTGWLRGYVSGFRGAACSMHMR